MTVTKRKKPAGRAASRDAFANRHKPVTIWFSTEEYALVAQHARERWVADPDAKSSVSGTLRELALGAIRRHAAIAACTPRSACERREPIETDEIVVRAMTCLQCDEPILGEATTFLSNDRPGIGALHLRCTASYFALARPDPDLADLTKPTADDPTVPDKEKL